VAPPYEPDVRERGADRDGAAQFLDRRLFMQLTVLQAGPTLRPGGAVRSLAAALERRGTPGVLYEDLNDPCGIGLLSWSEDPADLVTGARAAANQISDLRPCREMAMLGRSYSTGFEPDLEYWLLRRPRETVLNTDWPWAIWYPLRRTGAFERLEGRDKGAILREHGEIGKAYGAADLAHDVRLACHGLDANDNEFVIGLVGRDLHPLSRVVQAMRQTRQTSEFMARMGPFFVGRAAWRSAGKV
jgi:chlorite dismutase